MKNIYLTVLLSLFTTLFVNAQDIVISQFFGGNSLTNPYNQDFVEIFNKNASTTVDISGWTLQYGASGTTSNINVSYTFPGAINSNTTTIAPGKYYLIGLALTTGGGTSIPTPDGAATSVNISATNGKLAIVKNNTALLLTNPSGNADVSDFVGYGTSNLFDGAVLTGVLGTNIAKRLNDGCTDANNNSTDFAKVISTTVRNSSTVANICSTDPSISIVNPATGTTVHPWTNTVSVSTSNFNLALQGTIEYIVNGGTPTYSDATSFSFTETPGASMTINVQLVDNANQPLSPARTATTTFTFASRTVVANLAALRSAYVASAYYEVQTSPIATYTRTSRNQKYIQDATAGALIDDNSAVLNSVAIVENDAISGLKVQASEFANVLQIVPITASGVSKLASTAVVPQDITVAQYVAFPENYESELVKFTNVSLSPTGGNFAVNTDYTVTQGTDTTIFRTIFSEADYITPTPVAVPAISPELVALGAENATTKFVVARRLANITLGNETFDTIDGLQVYPNPSNTVLNITSDSFATKNIEIYSAMGTKVLSTQVTNTPVNVAGLTTGIYMLKVTQEGKIATRKLVIE